MKQALAEVTSKLFSGQSLDFLSLTSFFKRHCRNKNKREIKPVWFIPAIIGLVVGYFTGREHVKYELRQTFKTAAEGLTKSFGAAFGKIGSEKKAELPPPKTEKRIIYG